MSEVTIRVIRNGPYRVEGDIELQDDQRNPMEKRPGKGISLCRCGASENKPFCDGSHKRIGFEAE